MKKIIAMVALVFSCMLAYAQTNGEVIVMNKAMFIKDVFDYEKSQDWKYKGNKPAIIDLYADWCGPCRMVAPIMKELAKEYADKIVVYKVNVDKEKELAAAFLKALLGTDVQKTDLEDGFPVNADAYDMFTQTDNPDATVGFSASVAEEDGSTSGRVNFSASWPTEEEIVAFKEKIGTLTSPALSDDVIFTAVLEGGVKVLEGDLSLDEGCGEIVQKVELYLAE